MASSENTLGVTTSHEGGLPSIVTSPGPKAQQNGGKVFVTRNGRTYLADPTLVYPLPVDLAELHRQSLRTLLMFQLFSGPITSTAFANRPPAKVLEVGCGSGFWSMMCHRYFSQHGHSDIEFTGLDIAPLAGTGSDPISKPDKDMRWRFVQHDIRQISWPFPDGEFDLVMVKDMSIVNTADAYQGLVEEYHRVLKPGGVLEIWESDLSIRMLRPHGAKAGRPDGDEDSSGDEDSDAARLGAYVMGSNTPMSAPLNTFLVEYNSWITKAMDLRGLSTVPCTLIGPWLLQESEDLMDVRSKRLAIPLSGIRWEREGVGGVVTKDGKSYIDMKGKSKAGVTVPGSKPTGKVLTEGQAALRRTALETVVGLIHGFEPVLREVSGKSQDEWDNWTGKMMNDLLREGGTSWGECLEVGAWSAKKRVPK